MPEVKCKICGSSFYAKPYHVKRGWGKYCSRECHHKSMKARIELKCDICGKYMERTASDTKKSKSKKYFCSKSCQTQWRNVYFSGKRHANWKAGKRLNYRSILKKSDVPEKCQRCNSRDKRVLAVHHLDHDRENNSVDNLVWLCHNCHTLIHRDKVEEQKLMAILV